MRHRYFVTGTDTDVGKTRVAAALALALRRTGEAPTVVKAVQTGVAPGAEGDAARAGALAGVPHIELERFEKPADPWSAAVAAGAALRARDLAARIEDLDGPLVVEGSGGIMVPLNEREHLIDVVRLAKLEVVLAVGLRLGCINHALLTLETCYEAGIPVAGAMLVERWGSTDAEYRDDVMRALQESTPIVGILPFATAEADSVAAGANLLLPFILLLPFRHRNE
ncbi:MAG: dethiobiotin synthase [Candidatus Eremiobacteraeota bacterium]|nr:dethiobiotin synthase [Candidatus Eremiobacteraeota bacterium]